MALTSSDLPWLKKYEFRWEVIDVMIGGKSMFDGEQGLSGFPMKTVEEAKLFVKSYGFDLDDPIQKAELQGNFREAVNFVKMFFLQPENPEGLKLEVPRRLLESAELTDLLLMASMSFPQQTQDSNGIALRDWACAFLKVMHAIVHLDKDIRHNYFTEIQKQILDRYYRVVHRDGEGKLYLGKSVDDFFRVNLVGFDTKPKKTRESALLKILHKPENVADEIFDRVGLRFITENTVDALRVVKYLKDSMIVMPPNIKPSRSRNTLINVESLQNELASLLKESEKNSFSEEEFRKKLEAQVPSDAKSSDNPHSSIYYRALQFTGRQLIHFRNPLFQQLRELKTLLKTEGLNVTPQVVRHVEQIDLAFLQREVRFFYPYEVQVVDQKNHEENERGQSAHSLYKKSQVQSALKRVMGHLAKA